MVCRRLPLVVISLVALLAAACGAGGTEGEGAPEPDEAEDAGEPEEQEATEPEEEPTVEFPTGPVTFIVPYSAGGAIDTYNRVIAPYLEEELGVPVIVENMPGAGSATGYIELTRAEPDGHTFATFVMGALVAMWEEEAIPVDPLEMQWLGSVGTDYSLHFVSSSSPIMSMEDLMDLDGVLRYGDLSPTAGTTVQGTALLTALGIEYELITGFDGKIDLMPPLVRGEIEFGNWNEGPLKAWQDDVRVLLTGAPERSTVFPDAITIEELAEIADWDDEVRDTMIFGASAPRPVLAPAGVPEEHLAILRDALQSAATDPDYIQELEAAGPTAGYQTPEELIDVYNAWDRMLGLSPAVGDG
jgi:tripartite-type tricarboxylate transporter receptor subunit TctC